MVFEEQLGLFTNTYQKGMVDIHGNILIKPKCSKIFNSSNNTVSARSNGRFFVYSISPFKLLFKCDDIISGESDFLIYKEKDSKGWLVKSEDDQIRYELSSIGYFYGSTSENKLILRKQGKWLLFNLYSRVFEEFEMKQVLFSSKNHIVTKFTEEGFVKLIDDNQHLLIDGDYNTIKQMKSGFYLLGQKWHYGIFDRSGNEIAPCTSGQITYLDKFEVIQVRIGNKLSYLDMEGTWIR